MRLAAARAVLLAAALVGATACGSSGSDATGDTEPDVVDEPSTEAADPDTLTVEQPYVAAMAKAIASDVGIPEDDSTCVARSLIRELDLARLTTVDVTPEALAAAEDLSVFDAVEEGGEDRLAASLRDCQLGQLLAMSLFDDVGASSATEACLSASWRDAAPPLLARELVQGPAAISEEAVVSALIGSLPGECARSFVVDALIDGGATLAQSRCFEDKLPDDIARRLAMLQIEQDVAGLNAELEPIVRFCA